MDPLLAEQIAFYRAVAAEYSDHAIDETGGSEAGARFVQADLFAWEPDRRYDGVFFGFWISHVPEDRFDAFWELVYGEDSERIRRRLNDGIATAGPFYWGEGTASSQETHRDAVDTGSR